MIRNVMIVVLGVLLFANSMHHYVSRQADETQCKITKAKLGVYQRLLGDYRTLIGGMQVAQEDLE